jgi:hypothetical protein
MDITPMKLISKAGMVFKTGEFGEEIKFDWIKMVGSISTNKKGIINILIPFFYRLVGQCLAHETAELRIRRNEYFLPKLKRST